MKFKSLSVLFLSLFVGLTTFTSCDDDNDSIPKADSIVELVSKNSNLSTLVAALQKVDLVSALQADGSFTVFAPTNDAFQDLLDSNDSWSSLDDIPVETLKSVLLFHVLGSKVMSSDLSDTYVNTLATGPDMNFPEIG